MKRFTGRKILLVFMSVENKERLVIKYKVSLNYLTIAVQTCWQFMNPVTRVYVPT